MDSISSIPFYEEHIFLVNFLFKSILFNPLDYSHQSGDFFLGKYSQIFNLKKSDFNPHKGLLKEKWPK
jgi:hypothetical protein